MLPLQRGIEGPCTLGLSRWQATSPPWGAAQHFPVSSLEHRWLLNSVPRAKTRHGTTCKANEATTGLPLPIGDVTVVYSRNDTNRRTWLNPAPTIQALKRAFSFPVFVVSSMSAYSTCEQATLLSHARIVVWPHGGQTANIVYSRPGARVVELMCGLPSSVGSINSRPYAPNFGVWWKTVYEPSCTDPANTGYWDYSPRSFNLTVNVTKLLLHH